MEFTRVSGKLRFTPFWVFLANSEPGQKGLDMFCEHSGQMAPRKYSADAQEAYRQASEAPLLEGQHTAMTHQPPKAAMRR